MFRNIKAKDGKEETVQSYLYSSVTATVGNCDRKFSTKRLIPNLPKEMFIILPSKSSYCVLEKTGGFYFAKFLYTYLMAISWAAKNN